MRSYEAARSLYSLLGFIAWTVIIVGLIVAVAGVGGAGKYGGVGAGLFAMIPGIAIGVTGFILLAFVQMGRATVDTAEYTQQMLQISRGQLDVSRQALKAGLSAPSSFADTAPRETRKEGFAKGDFAAEARIKSPQQKTAELVPPVQIMIEGEKLEYMGHTITFSGGMYVINGNSFNSISLAKNHAERQSEMQKSRRR